MHDDLCAWCRRPEVEHGPAGEKPWGGPDGRLCPVPDVTSQFFTPVPQPPGMAGTVGALLGEARRLAERARQFDPVAGAVFGGNRSTGQHRALADAVDRLITVCGALAYATGTSDAAVPQRLCPGAPVEPEDCP